MKKLAALMQKKNIILSDGAWGTEIVKRGYETTGCPELFNVNAPDIIHDIADSYVAAGSDVILSNTFGGNFLKLERYGLGHRIRELNEAGIRLSREAASGKALVIGSIGPSGDFLEPLGTIREIDMVKAFAGQVRAFVTGGADAVLLETMTDLGELKCALTAVRDNSDFEVICSLTFDRGARGFATMMGVTPERAVGELEKAGADAVGANCGSGISQMIEITALMKPETGLPLWIKPNAGIPELIDDQTVYRESPEDMANRIPELVDTGATFIGGCCGTTPGHIMKFRQVIDTLLR